MGLMPSIVEAGFYINLNDESFETCMGKTWAF